MTHESTVSVGVYQQFALRAFNFIGNKTELGFNFKRCLYEQLLQSTDWAGLCSEAYCMSVQSSNGEQNRSTLISPIRERGWKIRVTHKISVATNFLSG